MIRSLSLALLALTLMVTADVPARAEQKKAEEAREARARTVQGTVTNSDGQPIVGAVVQLKNTKTLQIRSFITKDQGEYFFNGLSPDVDFELRAENNGASSATKTLSSFDSRKQAIFNLKLDK